MKKYIYLIDAQNKAGQWRGKKFDNLRDLIQTFMYWKALQYPFIKVQRRESESAI